MTQYTLLEEDYITHYQTKFTMSPRNWENWNTGLIARGDALVNIEGTSFQRMEALKAEADRRNQARKGLARYGG